VGIGAIINAVGAVHMFSFSIFFLPVSKDLNLSRTATSFVFSLARLEGGIEGPVVGWMIDRFGPRLPIAMGAALGGVGYLLFAGTVHSYLGFLLIYMGVISLGFNMSFIHAMHAVANLWFVRYRTRVMSIYSASLRLGTAIFTPIVAVIIIAYGWRMGAMVTGLLILGVAVPLSLFIRRAPETMGLLPDGAQPGKMVSADEQPREAASEKAGRMPIDFTLKETLHTPAYWIIAFSTTVRLSIASAVSVHFVPIFVWKGFEQQVGANMLALMTFIATGLILFIGWIGDKYSKKLILFSGQICLALSFLILAYADSIWLLYLFILLFGYGESMSPVNYSILGDYFGRKVFATLRGLLTSIQMIGVLTPVFTGWVYDRTEDYSAALYILAAFAAVAAVVLLMLRQPRKSPQS